MKLVLACSYGFLLTFSFIHFANGYVLRGYHTSALSHSNHNDMGFNPRGLGRESSSHTTGAPSTTSLPSSETFTERATSKPFTFTSSSNDDVYTSREDNINHKNDLEFESSFTAHTSRTTTVIPSFVLDLITTFTESITKSLPKLTTSSTSESASSVYDITSTSIEEATTDEYVNPIELSDVDYKTSRNSEILKTTVAITQKPSESYRDTTVDEHPTTLLTLNTEYTTKPTTLVYRRTTYDTTEPFLDHKETSSSMVNHHTTYTEPKTTTYETDIETTFVERPPSTTKETKTQSTAFTSVRSTTISSSPSESPIDIILKKLSIMKHPNHLVELLKHHEGPNIFTNKLNKKRWKLLQNMLKSFQGK